MASLQELLGRSLTQNLGLTGALDQRRRETEQLAQNVVSEGRLQGEQIKASAAKKRGLFSTIGTVLGTVGGAALGSVIPGAGTLAGAQVGASLGGAVGGVASGSADQGRSGSASKGIQTALSSAATLQSLKAEKAEKAEEKATEAAKTVEQKRQFEEGLTFKKDKLKQELDIKKQKLEQEGKAKLLKSSKEKERKPAQLLAQGFADRAQASNKIITDLRSGGFEPEGFLSAARTLLPNRLEGEARQRFERSKVDFVTAVLRRESGAAISDNEFKNENKKFFPAAGDKPKTIEDKRKARERAIANLRRDSGVKTPQSSNNSGVKAIEQRLGRPLTQQEIQILNSRGAQ